MKKISRILLVSGLGILFMQLASAQMPSRPFLQGKWEGVMTVVAAQPDGSPTISPPMQGAGQYGFRLDIRQTNLVMYFQNGDQWIGLGEGQDLRLNEAGRNSIVITALQPSANSIETMMLNITRWDEDTIAVHMSRVSSPDAEAGTSVSTINSFGRFQRGNW
jgi:hypothetical protein